MRLLSCILLLALASNQRTALAEELSSPNDNMMAESSPCNSEMSSDCQSCSNCPCPCTKPMLNAWEQRPCNADCMSSEKNCWSSNEPCSTNASCNMPCNDARMMYKPCNNQMMDARARNCSDEPFLVRLVKLSLKTAPYLMTFAYFKYLADHVWTAENGQEYVNKSANKILELGIGIWLYERIKADAKGLESMFFSALNTLTA